EEIRYIWRKKILSATVAVSWVLGPRFVYLVVMTTVSLVGIHLRARQLYICLPLLEYCSKLKGRWLSTSMNLAFDVYPRIFTYSVVITPALLGSPLRPEKLFPCIPYIYSFVLRSIHFGLLYQVFNFAETRIVLLRLE
ncbi:hypothetical protein DPMN_143974, partial [Dreissena polymorpha]